MIKIKIKQSKLLDLINYLSVDGLFPFSIITIRDKNILVSSQAEKEASGWRYVEFLPSYFEEMKGDDTGLRIDIESIRKFVSLRGADSIIELQYPAPKNKTMMMIKSDTTIDMLTVSKLDKKDIINTLPFQMEDGTPYLNKGKTPLSVNTTISKASMKHMSNIASAHGTEYFRFKIGKSNKLAVRIGDIKGVGNHSNFKPESTPVKTNEELDVTFTRGIKEISKTVHGDVDLYARTGMAGWFSEEGTEHKFGLLISPMKEKKD